MLQGIQLVVRNDWLPAIMEGDSRILIHMAQKLANGKSAEKVESNWRLARRMEDLRALILGFSVLSFQHVKREANRVADLMANVGVADVRDIRWGRLEDLEGEQWLPRCRQLADHDGGDRGQRKDHMNEERGGGRWRQGHPTRHLC